MSSFVRIVHLSDLHFGDSSLSGSSVDLKEKGFSRQIFTTDPAERILNFLGTLKPKPHFLVATGDFVSNSGEDIKTRDLNRRTRFAAAQGFLLKASSYLEEDESTDRTKRVLIVPGNHDANWDHLEDRLGIFKEYLGYKFLSPFYSDQLPPGIVKIGIPDAAAACYAFTEYKVLFYALSSPTHAGTLRDAVHSVLTSLGTLKNLSPKLRQQIAELAPLERIDAASITRPVIEGIAATLRWMSEKHVALEKYRKIGLLHHHLSPVSGIEVRSFEGTIDSAAAKTALADGRMDVILHGHKHRSELRYELTSASPDWGLNIAGAGSASGAGGSRASFYYLDFRDRRCSISEVSDTDADVLRPREPTWSFMPGSPPGNRIPIITWPGYRQAPSIIEEANASRVRFLEHSGIGGFLRDLRVDRDDCAMIIDDLDALERLHAEHNILLVEDNPVKELCRSRISGGINGVLPHDLCREFSPLPLRCGINAICYNAEHCNIPPGTSYSDILFGAEFAKYRLGFWDNAFVNIPLLILASGGVTDLDDVSLTDDRQVKGLAKRLGSKWNAISKRRNPVCKKYIRELRKALSNGTVQIVFGGGAWLSKGNTSLRTFVPEGGALLWLECAALLHPPNGTVEPGLRTFLARLLRPDVQRELSGGDEYSACPVTRVPDLWNGNDNDVQDIFSDERHLILLGGICFCGGPPRILKSGKRNGTEQELPFAPMDRVRYSAFKASVVFGFKPTIAKDGGLLGFNE